MKNLSINGIIEAVEVYEIAPRDNRKSFYGKAHILKASNGVKYLQSYNTIVASIDAGGNFSRYWDDYSATTARHIHAFRLGEGLAGICKKQWDALPVVDCDFVL